MKVLIIGTDSSKSGASLSMVVLAEKAKQKGIEIRIVIPTKGPLEEELNQRALEYYIVKSYNWIVSNQTSLDLSKRLKIGIKQIINIVAERKIEKIIKEYEPDIVHINTICSGVGAIAAYKAQKSVVWHIREFVEEDHGYTFWNKEKVYKLLSKSSALIAISDSVYKKFSPIFGRELMEIIYNGIDINKFYYETQHCFENKNIVNIYIGGSIAESKGQYLVIEAANYIKNNTNINFCVHIVGAGNEDYVHKLKNKVKDYSLCEKVIFEGFRNNMEEEWRKADIAVVASRAEAFGRVTVEAMLSNALVIGADSAGTAEIISDMQTGILFESQNYVSLAEKIIWATLNEKKSREIAANGNNYAKNKFGARRNAEEIIEVYKRVYQK